MTRETAAERVIPAPPAAVYAAIADYRHRICGPGPRFIFRWQLRKLARLVQFG